MDERRSESMMLVAENAHSRSDDSSDESSDGAAVLRRRPAANSSKGGSPSSIDPWISGVPLTKHHHKKGTTSMSPSRSSLDSLTKPPRNRSSSVELPASSLPALRDLLESIQSFCDHVADEEEQGDEQRNETTLEDPTNSMPDLVPFEESLSISNKRDVTITSPLRAFHSSSDMHSSASLICGASNNVQMERLKYLATLSPAELCKVKQQKFGHQTLAVTNALSSSQIHASLNKSTNKVMTSPTPFPNRDLKLRSVGSRRASAS